MEKPVNEEVEARYSNRVLQVWETNMETQESEALTTRFRLVQLHHADAEKEPLYIVEKGTEDCMGGDRWTAFLHIKKGATRDLWLICEAARALFDARVQAARAQKVCAAQAESGENEGLQDAEISLEVSQWKKLSLEKGEAKWSSAMVPMSNVKDIGNGNAIVKFEEDTVYKRQ